MTLSDFRVRVLEPFPGYLDENVIDRVARECWKMHNEDFNVCQQPACVLARLTLKVLDIPIGMNGMVR